MLGRLLDLLRTKKGRAKHRIEASQSSVGAAQVTSSNDDVTGFGTDENAHARPCSVPLVDASVKPELQQHEMECKLFKSQPAPVIAGEFSCDSLADDAVEQAGTYKTATLLAQSVYMRLSSSPGNSFSQTPTRLCTDSRPPSLHRHGSVNARDSAYQQHTSLFGAEPISPVKRLQRQQHQQRQHAILSGAEMGVLADRFAPQQPQHLQQQQQQHSTETSSSIEQLHRLQQRHGSAENTSASSVGSLPSIPMDGLTAATAGTLLNSESQIHNDQQPVVGKYQRISMQHAQLREHVRFQKEQDSKAALLAPVVPSQHPPAPSSGTFKRSSNQSTCISPAFSTTPSLSLLPHSNSNSNSNFLQPLSNSQYPRSNSLQSLLQADSSTHSSPQDPHQHSPLLPLSSVLAASGSVTCPSLVNSSSSSFSLAQTAAPLSPLPPVGELQEGFSTLQQSSAQVPVSNSSTGSFALGPSSQGQSLASTSQGQFLASTSQGQALASTSQGYAPTGSPASITRKRLPPADIVLRSCAVHATALQALGVTGEEEYTRKVAAPLLQLPQVAALVHRVLDSACGIQSMFAVVTLNRSISTLFPPAATDGEKSGASAEGQRADTGKGISGGRATAAAAAAAAAAGAGRRQHFTIRPCVCQDDSAASSASRFIPGIVLSFCTSPTLTMRVDSQHNK